MDIEQLRYPIGRFRPPAEYNEKDRKKRVEAIRVFPEQLASVVRPLTPPQLDTPYRPDGWTIRQLVHHIADSHLNSYIRFKWTVTEDSPLIKPYDQDAWGSLTDAQNGAIRSSLLILEGIHERWCQLLDSFKKSDYKKELRHPEFEKPLSLDFMLALYAWHCKHHLAHIEGLIEREGW